SLKCGFDCRRACDGASDVFRDARSQRDELGDSHELDSGVRSRVDSRVGGVDARDGLARRLVEGRTFLELGVVERGLALDVGNTGPAVFLSDELLVLTRTCPGDELPRGVLLVRGFFDAPRPGPEPTG